MKARILIVDDNEAIRRALTALLQTRVDWEVCGQAQNGEEGVAKAAELHPDLIILDLVMTGMDGLRTALAIGKRSPTVPILLHTQHCSPAIELEAKKFGVRKVVAKAQPVEILFRAIEELLGAGQAIPAESSPAASAIAAATIAESTHIDTTFPSQASAASEGPPASNLGKDTPKTE
jgi:DNA-binding NarL/FixJ family response regulator